MYFFNELISMQISIKMIFIAENVQFSQRTL